MNGTPDHWRHRLRLFKPAGITADHGQGADEFRLMLSGFFLAGSDTGSAHLLRGLADWEALASANRPCLASECLVCVSFMSREGRRGGRRGEPVGYMRRREVMPQIMMDIDVTSEQLAILSAGVAALQPNQQLELELAVEREVRNAHGAQASEGKLSELSMSSAIASYSIQTVDRATPAYVDFALERERGLGLEVSMSSPDIYFVTHTEEPGGIRYRYHATLGLVYEHPMKALFERSLRESGFVIIRQGRSEIEPYQVLSSELGEDDAIYGVVSIVGDGRDTRQGANGRMYGSNAWDVDVRLPPDLMSQWTAAANLGQAYGGVVLARIGLDVSAFKPDSDVEAFISDKSVLKRFPITSFQTETVFPDAGDS